jgi:hypothetical protein
MRRTGTSGIPEDFIYHSDVRGSVVAISDATGAVVERCVYGDHGEVTVRDAFGNVLAGSSVGNPYFYGGERLEASGFYHLGGSEFYEPATGRFVAGGETCAGSARRLMRGRDLKSFHARSEAGGGHCFEIRPLTPDTTIDGTPAERRGKSVRSPDSLVFNVANPAHSGSGQLATGSSHSLLRLGTANGGVERPGIRGSILYRKLPGATRPSHLCLRKSGSVILTDRIPDDRSTQDGAPLSGNGLNVVDVIRSKRLGIDIH